MASPGYSWMNLKGNNAAAIQIPDIDGYFYLYELIHKAPMVQIRTVYFTYGTEAVEVTRLHTGSPSKKERNQKNEN